MTTRNTLQALFHPSPQVQLCNREIGCFTTHSGSAFLIMQLGKLVTRTESILIKHIAARLNISQYVLYDGSIYVPCKLSLNSQFSKVIYEEICFTLHLDYLKP